MSTTSEAQLRALEVLAPVLPEDAYLAGGIALGLRFAHRTSKDLDVFTLTSEPEQVVDALAGRADVRVTTRAEGTVYLEIAGVPVSIIRHGYPLLEPPEHLAGAHVPVARLADLTAMKLHAISSRGAARDFWDLHELIIRRKIVLADALAEVQRRYPIDDVGHVVRSLAYFGDAEAAPLPVGLDTETWKRIRADFEKWVAEL